MKEKSEKWKVKRVILNSDDLITDIENEFLQKSYDDLKDKLKERFVELIAAQKQVDLIQGDINKIRDLIDKDDLCLRKNL